MVLGIILAIIVVLVIAAIMLYNNLVKMRNMVDNAWAQIDVQLQGLKILTWQLRIRGEPAACRPEKQAPNMELLRSNRNSTAVTLFRSSSRCTLCPGPGR